MTISSQSHISLRTCQVLGSQRLSGGLHSKMRALPPIGFWSNLKVRPGVQVHIRSKCEINGRTFGAGQTGTGNHRSMPRQWQPGRAATGSYSERVWRSVNQWVSPHKTEIVRKSKKFQNIVNYREFQVSTVTLLCENTISMEVSRCCCRGTLLPPACLILRVSIDYQVIAYGEGIKLRVLNCIQFRAAELNREAVHEQSLCRFSNRRSQQLQIAVRQYLRTASSMKSNRLHTVSQPGLSWLNDDVKKPVPTMHLLGELWLWINIVFL